MSKSKKERIYDDIIAPLMAQIIEVCKENEISVSAVFELTQDLTVMTHIPVNPESARMRLEYYLMKADGNLDLFFMNAKRDAEKYGHSSCVLSLLGARTTPNRQPLNPTGESECPQP